MSDDAPKEPLARGVKAAGRLDAVTSLDPEQSDRARGVLLGVACGDALGAGYEFGPPLPSSIPVAMIGGGTFGWAPGEWTDDTAMSVAIAQVAASGLDLRSDAAQAAIVRSWHGWSRNAADVGIQTRAALDALDPSQDDPALALAARRSARAVHEATGRSGGNGSLMRTAPVALAFIADPAAMIEAATALSALTHFDAEAGEACVIWCLIIRHAVLTGDLGASAGLDGLDSLRRDVWADRLVVAEASRPRDFARNGWVVEALQAAWSSITGAARFEDGLRRGLEAAVRGGGDTDTVAAIAGAVLGATYGAAAVPSEWTAQIHGWPGITADTLNDLNDQILDSSIQD